MSRHWRRRIGIAILCTAFLPLLSLAILIPLTLIGDCRLGDGNVTHCVIDGTDLGEPLTRLGNFAAWGVLLTGPLAIALAALWGAAELGLWVGQRVTRR